MTNLLLPYEIIRDIPGYEGLYKVSARGKLISCSKAWKFKIKNETVLATNIGSTGYIVNVLFKKNKHKTVKVHRLVGQIFIPNPENKKCINHLDGIKTNNDVTNLEWVTHNENALHAFRTKLRVKIGTKGESRCRAKLTNEEALKIREIDLPHKILAIQFGVSKGTISGIKTGKRYAI